MHFSLKHNEYTQYYCLNTRLSQMLNWEKDRPSNIGSGRGRERLRAPGIDLWRRVVRFYGVETNRWYILFFFLPTITPPWAPSGIYILYWHKGQKLFGSSAGVTHNDDSRSPQSPDSYLWVLWMMTFFFFLQNCLTRHNLAEAWGVTGVLLKLIV